MDGNANPTSLSALKAAAAAAGQVYANESAYREARGYCESTRAWDRFCDWLCNCGAFELTLSIDASELEPEQREVWEAFREEFDGYLGR